VRKALARHKYAIVGVVAAVAVGGALVYLRRRSSAQGGTVTVADTAAAAPTTGLNLANPGGGGTGSVLGAIPVPTTPTSQPWPVPTRIIGTRTGDTMRVSMGG
jgi:hypothetical protein